MAHLASLGDVAPEIAVAMATGNTARVHGLDVGRLAPGRAADIVLVDAPIGSSGVDARSRRSASATCRACRWCSIDGEVHDRPEPEHAAGRPGGRDRRRRRARQPAATEAMQYGLRLPSFALGAETASLQEMGAYLRRAEDLGFESAMLIDHLLIAPPAYRVAWLEPVVAPARARRRHADDPPRHPRARAAVPRPRRVREGVGDPRPALAAAGRSSASAWAGTRRSSRRCASRIQERGRRMNEMLEAITALWAGDDVSYEGTLLPLRAPDDRAEAGPEAAPADLDRRRHAALGEDLRPGRRHDPAGAAADREVRLDLGAALLGDRRDGRRGLGAASAATWSRSGETRTTCAGCTRTSCTSCSRARSPSRPRRSSACTRGMDLDVLAGVLPARRGRGGGRADPRQDRGARRRRPPDPQPARLGSGKPRGPRRARPAARRAP